MALSDKLTGIATRFAEEIAAVVREEMMSAMGMGISPSAATLPETKRRGRPAYAATPRAVKAPTAKRRYPEHCLAKGCKRPHGGPRSGFFCPEHREKLGALDRKAAQMAWKAAQASP